MVDHPETFNSCIGLNFTWCLENEQVSNNSNSTTDISIGELAVMITKGVALGFIVLLTIGGNTLVLVAVMFNLHLRSTTNYFIVNLAVADLLLGTTVLPFSASLEVLGRWSFGQVFCDVWAAVDVLCCTASIMSLCVISLDRYIGVTRPLTYTTIMTERRSILFIFFIWIASIIISVGPLFGWKEPPSDDQNECNVTSQPGYVLFSVAGSFYIPTCVILMVYARIYRAAVRQTRFLERGIKTTKASGGSIESSGASGSTSEVTLRVHTGGVGTRLQSCDNLNLSPSCLQVVSGQQGRLAKFKRQKKAAKTLGIVVGVFILCWFPFFFVLPLRSFCSSCYVPDTLFQIFFWLGYCNSCLNPIIYAKSSRDFKRAFKRILRCRLGKQLPASSAPWHRQTVAVKSSNKSENADENKSRKNPNRLTVGTSDVSFMLEKDKGSRAKVRTARINGIATTSIN